MRPILYPGDETLFTNNGLGRLADCTRCIVTEERNGVYLCEFDYPVTGPMYPALLEGGIVAVIHDDKRDIQPFDIYGHTAQLDGVVTFYARHISYRLSRVILRPVSAGSCASALAAMQANTYNPNPFMFWTDKAVSGEWVNDVPASVKFRLMGERGSILDVYGKGEYEWDKWTVRLHVNRGADNGVSIRYGVNLTKLDRDVDTSTLYSAVAPYWRSADGAQVVMLPEGYVIAGQAPVNMYSWTAHTGDIITNEAEEPIEFAVPQIIPVPLDLSEVFEEAPTVAQLRQTALSRLNSSEAWLPKENITISFVDLAQTEDYKDVAALQRVSLCDRVSVYCGPLGVSAAKVQVIKTVYDVLEERYSAIELGKPRSSYADTLMAQVEKVISDRPTVSMLAAAVNSATQQITGARDSHVRFIYDADGGLQEIVIMDTDSITTAAKVWRWNSGGLGFSSNGYAGPYGTAITQDGAIVADFVSTGTLSAEIIAAHSINVSKLTGTIRGGLNSSWEIDLANGTMTIGNISAANVTTGTLSAERIAANSINVSKLTGSISGGLNNSWVINLTNGTMTIGNISAANVTTGTLSAERIAANSINVSKLTGSISGGLNNSWVINLTNGTMTIGNISAANITTGTMSANRIQGGTIDANNVTITNLNASSITSGPFKVSGNDVVIDCSGYIDLNGDIKVNDYRARSAVIIVGGNTYNFHNGILVENI